MKPIGVIWFMLFPDRSTIFC